MILVGLDDTDTVDSRGTNQLAKSLARRIAAWSDGRMQCTRIVRHQLLVDDRVPYTSKNGSASMWFSVGRISNPSASGSRESTADGLEIRPTLSEFHVELRQGLLDDFVPGSDPGLCIARADAVPDEVVLFGRRCQEEIVSQLEARGLAARSGLHLEGLGGTEDGVVGALAAVGLATTRDDGRIVFDAGWPSEEGGSYRIQQLADWGIDVVNQYDGRPASANDELRVDVGKKLRPNLVAGRVTLFVEAAPDGTLHARKRP